MLKPIRVAVIDSGVKPAHSHVKPIVGGVSITPEGAMEGCTDLLGGNSCSVQRFPP